MKEHLHVARLGFIETADEDLRTRSQDPARVGTTAQTQNNEGFVRT